MSEVRRAMGARVQRRERVQQGEHGGPLVGGRLIGVVRGGRMEERPGRAAELLYVGRALHW